ncbi:MAG: hypothetical protein R3E72_03980 [Steroidobacteraceae bacterium]|jgi:hypothetical protein
MSSDPRTSYDATRRARVRRTAIVLGLVALGFYLGFIALSVSRAQ